MMQHLDLDQDLDLTDITSYRFLLWILLCNYRTVLYSLTVSPHGIWMRDTFLDVDLVQRIDVFFPHNFLDVCHL